MGEHEGLAASSPHSGVLPNGLLPGKAVSVMRPVDTERWAEAEDRTAKLIACIQPNPPSEDRRNAVARYVRRLIMECFPSQVEVFTFGSVPLKTYLPDGDIDLTAFSRNQNLKDSWAHLVRDMLQKEEKNENAEFHVKEVQYIQADVKIIKCLVENIVVDISFNQLGGLCTLCFLEEVDHYINQNHLFKRSIILIKAWCYYESRILGAHHGLISTYALETLVLYIFHVFNNSFAGPLEVLYRFLEFFSKFDWENFCVSLWGPVPITSLPDVTAESPRNDGGELQVSEVFLKACSRVYAVYPIAQENQGLPFASKHFNVIDPLRENNNLGRSVSKGNFFRIRSAFAFGAKKLARLLDCPKEDLSHQINRFFMNTWERHGSGHRPDAPGDDLLLLRPSDPDPQQRVSEISSNHENNCQTEHIARRSDGSGTSRSQKSSGHVNSSRIFDQSGQEFSSSNDEIQKGVKPESVVNNIQGRHLFARTRSSPELKETYGEARRGKDQTAPTKKTEESEALSSYPRSSRQILDNTAETNSAAVNYQDNLGFSSLKEEASMGGTQGMQQEEQDAVNMMSNAVVHGFNGQFPFSLNFATGHVPFPIPPSMLASMGYGQRNLVGGVPSNLPFSETSWGSNVQFPQSLASSPYTHFFHGGFVPSPENSAESAVESEHDFCNVQERVTIGPDLENGGYGTRSSSEGNQMQNDERATGSSRSVSRASSVRSKTSSESSWDGLPTKGLKPGREKRNRKVVSYGTSASVSGKGMAVPEHIIQVDDDSLKWVPVSSSDVAERDLGPPQPQRHHQVNGLEVSQTSGSDSSIPLFLGHGLQQRTVDNSGYTFYPTGPPVPIVAMFPMYNFQGGDATSDASTSHLCDNDSSSGLDQSEVSNSSHPTRTPVAGELAEPVLDILNGDFVSHWQNLQYGRLCQNPQCPPMLYPAPVTVPPAYRPLAYANIANQLMPYGPRIVPVAPLQPVSPRPANMYPRYGDEMPRYRSGTGTYFPNPKISYRERHSSMRRGNYGHERNERRSDRDENWNVGKSRGSGRGGGGGGYNRGQAEKSSPRQDRSDRPWGSYRPHDSSSHHSQNGPMGYSVYQNSVSSEGQSGQSVVMFYPYDHNPVYNPQSEQLEFGSLGPNEAPLQLNEGSLSSSYSAPDHRPSSPHLPRGK